MAMHRIVVCLDVEAESMKEAYGKVYQTLKAVDCEDFQWESSDEWYDPDGGQLPAETVQKIRMEVFAEENPCHTTDK